MRHIGSCIHQRLFHSSKMASVLSGLARIETEHTNPHSLFQEWLSEAKEHGFKVPYMYLATASKTGHVSNRTVVLRDVLDDGSLVFLCPTTGRKVQHIVENPLVASTFHFTYSKSGTQTARQVRFEGVAVKLSTDYCRMLYEREPLYCKIRSAICRQGQQSNWESLKAKHDAVLKEIIEKKQEPELPDNLVAYKIVPQEVDFYYAFTNHIGDRIVFNKISDLDWSCKRIQA